MDDEVRSAGDAMDVARRALEKAGYGTFFMITDAVREDGTWIVRALTVAGQITIKIRADTGDVVEFRRTAPLGKAIAGPGES